MQSYLGNYFYYFVISELALKVQTFLKEFLKKFPVYLRIFV